MTRARDLADLFTGVDITGNVTATGTVEPAGDTAAGDNAAIGFTSAEGLILTGQGSTVILLLKMMLTLLFLVFPLALMIFRFQITLQY